MRRSRPTPTRPPPSRARARSTRSASVGLRARAVLSKPLLLLRLQQDRHAPDGPRRRVRRAGLLSRNRAAQPVLRPQPDSRTTAFRRRHADLSCRPPAGRGDGHDRSTVPADRHGSRDYSIEIDPRTVDADYLEILSDLGFNRLSLGVQDYDPGVQQAINRIQPQETVDRVLTAARALGFRSINFDLIYGLPRQTPATFAATLDRVIAQRPDRLAVYALRPHAAVVQGATAITGCRTAGCGDAACAAADSRSTS